MSHMMLRRKGPITIGLRFRDTISCAFIPHSVGASSVRVRQDTTKSCYRLKTSSKIPTLSRKKNATVARSIYLQHANAFKNRIRSSSIPLVSIRQWTFDSFQMDQPKTRLIST